MIAFRTPQLFLRPLIPLLVLMVLFCLVAPSNADKNLLDELRDLDIFQLKSGISACPLPVVGERCPPSNSLFYFKCCGELNTSCCVRLQDWAVGIIAVLVILVLIGAFVNLFRCIFCGA